MKAGMITTTSARHSVLAKALGEGVKVLVWDEIEKYPDALELMTAMESISDYRLSWDAIRHDPNSPELLEYAG
jgi:hypothetical protein